MAVEDVMTLAERFCQGGAVRAASLALSASLVAAHVGPSRADPCAVEIDRLQARIDASLDAQAGRGRTARESGGALEHRQPTPETILEAEEALGEAGALRDAMAALERARRADRAGDARACEEALAAARRALRP